MAIVGPFEHTFSHKTTGKVGVPFQYGDRIYGQVRYGAEEYLIDFKDREPTTRYGIYCRRTIDGKQKIQRKNFYIPANPNTDPQKVQREKFGNGMTAWALLTDEQKAVYNQRAQKYKMHGVNLFLREWIHSH